MNRCPAESIASLRDIFYDVTALQPKVERLVRETGRERALDCHRAMEDDFRPSSISSTRFRGHDQGALYRRHKLHP